MGAAQQEAAQPLGGGAIGWNTGNATTGIGAWNVGAARFVPNIQWQGTTSGATYTSASNIAR